MASSAAAASAGGIDTGSGDVAVDQADVRNLKIDTGSGNADATAVRSQDLLPLI